MKFIIAIINPSNHGKTEVLQECINKFHFKRNELFSTSVCQHGDDNRLEFSNDLIRVIAHYRDKLIGFKNIDDCDIRSIESELKDMLNCDIIILTCRKRLGIKENLLQLSEQHSYNLTLCGNFYLCTSTQPNTQIDSEDMQYMSLLNQCSAGAVKDLVENLIEKY